MLQRGHTSGRQADLRLNGEAVVRARVAKWEPTRRNRGISLACERHRDVEARRGRSGFGLLRCSESRFDWGVGMELVMKTLKYTGFALGGAVIGVGVALLTAPASGRETRRRISRRIAEEKKALLRRGQRAVDEASEYIQDQLRQGKRMLEEVVSR